MNRFDFVLLKILKYGLWLALFTPLVVFRNAFSPFNFGKAVVFRVLIELLFAVYVVAAWRQPQLRIWRVIGTLKKGQRLIVIMLALSTLSFVISTFLSLGIHESFWGTWERMGGLFGWFHFVAFFMIAISSFRSQNEWMGILWLSVLAADLSSIYGFIQLLNVPEILGASERLRIFGTLGNPAAFAGYLLLSLYLAVFLYQRTATTRSKMFLAPSSLFFVTGILLTAVRGAVLALVVSGAFLTIVFVWRALQERNYQQLRRIGLTVGVAVVISVCIGATIGRSQVDRVRHVSFEDATVKQRLGVWGIAMRGMLDYPLFGWGPEQFVSLFGKHYQGDFFRDVNDVVFDRAHNGLIDVAVAQGIVGLSIWLGFLALLFLQFWRSGVWALCAALIAYGVHTFFFFDLFSTFLILLLLAGIAVASEGSRGIIEHYTSRVGWSYAVLGGILVVTIWLAWQYTIRPARANFLTTRAVVYFGRNNISSGLVYADKALANANWSKVNVTRTLADGLVGALQRAKTPNKELAGRGFLVDLDKILSEQAQNSPLDYPALFYAYRTARAKAFVSSAPQGDKDRPEALLTQGLERLPNVVPLMYELSELALEKKRFDQALSIINTIEQRTYAPAVTFQHGRVLVLKKLTEKDTADPELIIRALSEGYVNGVMLAQFEHELLDRKGYDVLVVLYNHLAKENPRYLVALSVTYVRMKEYLHAREVADRILVLDYETIGSQGFQTLAEIYQILGDNSKRSQALLKSTP